MSHFQPKRWLHPRSRRWHEAHDGYEVTVTDILKEKYQGGEDEELRPAWAKLACARNWMTLGEYFAVPPEQTGRKSRIHRLVYAASPLMGLLKKTTNFGGPRV